MIRVIVLTDHIDEWMQSIKRDIRCKVDAPSSRGARLGNDTVMFYIYGEGQLAGTEANTESDPRVCVVDRIATAEELMWIERHVEPYSVRRTARAWEAYRKRVIRVRLNTVSQVKEFVKIANAVTGDVAAEVDDVLVDAKSVLGVMSLNLSKPLRVVLPESAGEDTYAAFERLAAASLNGGER